MNHQNYWNSYCWYAVYTHSEQGNRAENNLRAWGIETFSPEMRFRKFNKWSTQFEYRTKSLFPRYVLVRFQINALYHKIRITCGVHSLVSFGDSPTSLPDEIIELIRSRMGDERMVLLGETILPGDGVPLKGGLLKGFTGVFQRWLPDGERVRILIDTISYQAHVVLRDPLIKTIKQFY